MEVNDSLRFEIDSLTEDQLLQLAISREVALNGLLDVGRAQSILTRGCRTTA